MELHEEYLTRRCVKAHCIKYVDRANLILKSKDSSDQQWAWLHVAISSNGDTSHPLKYTFVISANPTLYSTSDMNHISQHSKVLKEHTWEWDQYESGLLNFAKEHCNDYIAITSEDAIFVAWEMFVTNYDAWIAHFLPFRMQDGIYQSFSADNRAEKILAIREIEDYIKSKYERVYICWRSIKSAIEQKNYADWLAKIINEIRA